jgi:hypothetical protein
MSLPVMWRKEHLWNFSVLRRVRLSNPVCKGEVVAGDQDTLTSANFLRWKLYSLPAYLPTPYLTAW